MQYFGDRIAQARFAKGLLAKDLINKLAQNNGTIISPAYMSKIENCTDIPTVPTIVALCKILDLPVDEMIEICKKEEMHAFKLRLETKYRRHLQ